MSIVIDVLNHHYNYSVFYIFNIIITVIQFIALKYESNSMNMNGWDSIKSYIIIDVLNNRYILVLYNNSNSTINLVRNFTCVNKFYRNIFTINLVRNFTCVNKFYRNIFHYESGSYLINHYFNLIFNYIICQCHITLLNKYSETIYWFSYKIILVILKTL